MKNRLFLLILMPLLITLNAQAQDSGNDDDFYQIGPYQIGSEWGKKPVTLDSLKTESPVFQRAAKATGRIDAVGGTAFYLGKFNGHHVVATNHHVCEIGADCLGDTVSFPMIQKEYDLKVWVATAADIDLTLQTIDVPAADEPLLLSIAQNFAFDQDVTQGEPLLTLGFGAAGNRSLQMVANQDSDCVVISKTADYQLLADPDTVTPVDYKAWSFSSGCDDSHGDSGSPMIDRNTGAIVGILWTGRTPKPNRIQDSSYIQSLISSPNKDVWTELTYAVPAKKMRDSLLNYANTYKWITPDAKKTILEIIGKTAP